MTLSKQQKEQIENFVAGFFEKSDDIVRATFAIQTYVERQLDLVAKRDAQTLEAR